jgi:hypothetical protein
MQQARSKNALFRVGLNTSFPMSYFLAVDPFT